VVHGRMTLLGVSTIKGQNSLKENHFS